MRTPAPFAGAFLPKAASALPTMISKLDDPGQAGYRPARIRAGAGDFLKTPAFIADSNGRSAAPIGQGQ
jgi:hypothetical protein